MTELENIATGPLVGVLDNTFSVLPRSIIAQVAEFFSSSFHLRKFLVGKRIVHLACFFSPYRFFLFLMLLINFTSEVFERKMIVQKKCKP